MKNATTRYMDIFLRICMIKGVFIIKPVMRKKYVTNIFWELINFPFVTYLWYYTRNFLKLANKCWFAVTIVTKLIELRHKRHQDTFSFRYLYNLKLQTLKHSSAKRNIFVNMSFCSNGTVRMVMNLSFINDLIGDVIRHLIFEELNVLYQYWTATAFLRPSWSFVYIYERPILISRLNLKLFKSWFCWKCAHFHLICIKCGHFPENASIFIKFA